MKKTQNAIEKQLPDDIRIIASASSGCLMAVVWKHDGSCNFIVYREDPETGELFRGFEPSDVESLAKLVTIVAETLHRVGYVSPSLSADLGCLAHCLADTLGLQLDGIDLHNSRPVQ